MTTYTDFFQQIQYLEAKKLPFVAFKQPLSTKIQLFWQENQSLFGNKQGFLMQSFHENAIFIACEGYKEADFGQKPSCASAAQDGARLAQHCAHQTQDCVTLTQHRADKTQNSAIFAQDSVSTPSEGSYKKQVVFAIEQIEKGYFQKVVLSRKVRVRVKPASLAVYFERLCEKYPSAFCYVCFHPEIGKWVAATPETLLYIQGNSIQTMALAGTKQADANENPSWSDKEKAEQGWVTSFIEEALQGITTNLHRSEVKNVRAGNLWHLCTEISAEKKETTSVETLLQALHPTPAVCGYPTQPALDFILHNEGYARDYYTGYCGIVGFPQTDVGHYFVNLRCMQLEEDTANIFVGAGITENSDPQSEWDETQHKLQTMLSIL